jgi:hypothetical protein
VLIDKGPTLFDPTEQGQVRCRAKELVRSNAIRVRHVSCHAQSQDQCTIDSTHVRRASLFIYYDYCFRSAAADVTCSLSPVNKESETMQEEQHSQSQRSPDSVMRIIGKPPSPKDRLSAHGFVMSEIVRNPVNPQPSIHFDFENAVQEVDAVAVAY